MMRPRVLVVDDDAGVRFMLRGILEEEALDVTEALDGQDALEQLTANPTAFDLVITDLRMPRLDGFGLLDALVQRGIVGAEGGLRVIVVTAHGSERHAVEAMKRGAFDYFRKPFETDELVAVVRRAVENVRLRADNEALRSQLHLTQSLLFASPAMTRLATLVQRVASKDVTVLITGESGTGKERIAEAIVRASRRADKPFIRFNCAALPSELVEAELFGHARGAFTGAARTRLGLFREADGGTLLLDEVGELDPSAQAKLLRVLQDGEIRPLGEDRATRVDVRIIACTHRDLGALVRERRFREDLSYRLRVVLLEVPPLRERPEDIPLLAREFLRRAAERFAVPSVSPSRALLDRLTHHRWPGNVRELEHAMESLVALSPNNMLDPSVLESTTLDVTDPAAGSADDANTSLKKRVEAYERGLIVSTLGASAGNRSETARVLGIGRATLHEKMTKYGIT